MIGYIGCKLKQYTMVKLIIFAFLMLTGLIIGMRFFGSYTKNAFEYTIQYGGMKNEKAYYNNSSHPEI